MTESAAIPANQFTDDNGNPVVSFPVLDVNGYNDLYINGMLQEGNTYSVGATALNFSPGGGVIYSGTPIILQFLQFFAMVS
ncbi:DUF4183 domain-containing protein [Paenibacillus sp. HW567]|uniref:DUF4183 domain-containing protein n=1 Tax=Paenibacillus sp. HW567 TaxID=1034769 RepID=UPI000685D330|nr:DUF4183 domain-containing protein [Paenibacillus sp. HW567]